MAFQIEAGTGDDSVELAAQIRDGADRTGIDGRREQSDDTKFPDELAVGTELFDADVIHMDAAMHAGAHRRLGHDERLWFVEEGADLRSNHDQLLAATDHVHVARAENPEAGFVAWLERVLVSREHIIARAEKS